MAIIRSQAEPNWALAPCHPNYFNSILNYNSGNSFGTGTITMTTFCNGSAMAAEGSSLITIPNSFTAATANLNIVPGSGGTTFSGPWSLSSGNPTIGTGSTAGSVLTISGVISGAGNFNAYNNGTLTLKGANTYSGSTSNSCPLVISGSGDLGDSGGTGSYAGKITNNSSFTYNSSANQTLSGVISGSGALIQNGSGNLTLTGVETYTGGTSNGSTLIIGGAGQLGSGTYAGKITNNGTFVYNSSASESLTGIVSGTGNVVQSGAGTLTLSAVETYTGGTSNGTTLTVGGAGTITAAGNIINNGTLNYSSSATENISGVISGSGALKVTSGTLTLSGVNTYTGITTVSGGVLNIPTTNGIGAMPGSFTANQITLGGGTLGLTATAVDLDANRGITLTANSTISASSSQTPSIEGVITGGFGLTKTSSGNLNLNAANTFTGGLTITGGGVRFNNNSAAGTGTITVTPTSIITLRMLQGSPTSTEAPLFNVTLANAMAALNANGVNDIDLACGNGQSLAFTGNISGVGYLTRDRGASGNGSIFLSGSNSFSGGLLWRGSIIGVGSSNALGTGAVLMSPANADPLTLSATTPLTGTNALTNAVQIAISNATEQITITGSNALELAGPVTLAQTGSLPPVITNNNTGSTTISGVISSGLSGHGSDLRQRQFQRVDFERRQYLQRQYDHHLRYACVGCHRVDRQHSGH